jgi:DNA-binding PadR family transcriptional regulator
MYISQDDITAAERIDHMGINTPALTEAVYYILLSLMQPLHGYGIMQNVEQLSGGRLRLAAGTLYGAISSMLDKGWITALDGAADSRKKEYVITEAGRDILRAEYTRLKELVSNGRAALEMEAEDA